MRPILLLSAALLLSACATQPPGAESSSAETREAVPASTPEAGGGENGRAPSAPATPSSSLLASVNAAIAAGRLEQAAALCERALRISPSDPMLWFRLAGIRFTQERYGEAMNLARRAALYADTDTPLARSINRLLEQSRAALNATAE